MKEDLGAESAPFSAGVRPPWCIGGLRLTRAVLDALERDAITRYATPEEACGYLVGPADDPLLCDELVALPNLANKLHALDPETYFRDGRTFFAFHEKRFDDAVRAGKALGRPVKVLYHSHLDAGAYFSVTDSAVLSQGEPPSVEGGPARLGVGPAWPLAFLVTSVRGLTGAPVVDDHKVFVWEPRGRGPGAFVESAFEIVGAAP
ncbi:MAG: Mov34/MPN/PAD-1 family protein [Polyangiaceae bacterium]